MKGDPAKYLPIEKIWQLSSCLFYDCGIILVVVIEI